MRSPIVPVSSADQGLRVRLKQADPIPLDVDIFCHPGEVVALVGPSGSGKSTVLRTIAGLYQPQHGMVSCDGTQWLDTETRTQFPPQRRSVGMVFQSYALFPHMTVLGNVLASMNHISKATRHTRAMNLLAKVHLVGLEDRYPAALSGGQQQRVAVARALARDPDVLLLDEPFSAVDRVTRQKLYVELAELRRDLKFPTILVTHDLEEASALADRICILHHGKVLQTGIPNEVKTRPVSVTVARLVEVRNVFSGIVEGHDDSVGATYLQWQGRTLSARLQPEFSVGENVAWCIPASYVLLHRTDRPSRGDAENPLSGVIIDMLPLGETVRMTVAVDNSDALVNMPVLMHVVQRHELEPGREINLTLRSEGIQLMPEDV